MEVHNTSATKKILPITTIRSSGSASRLEAHLVEQMKNTASISIGILLYGGFAALDAIGPNQVFFFFKSFSTASPPIALYLIDRKKKEEITSPVPTV